MSAAGGTLDQINYKGRTLARKGTTLGMLQRYTPQLTHGGRVGEMPLCDVSWPGFHLPPRSLSGRSRMLLIILHTYRTTYIPVHIYIPPALSPVFPGLSLVSATTNSSNSVHNTLS
jgi:hypothetical protein